MFKTLSYVVVSLSLLSIFGVSYAKNKHSVTMTSAEMKEASKFYGAMILCPESLPTQERCHAMASVLRDIKYPVSFAIDRSANEGEVKLFVCGKGGTKTYNISEIDGAKETLGVLRGAYDHFKGEGECSDVSIEGSEGHFKTNELAYHLYSDIECRKMKEKNPVASCHIFYQKK